PSATATPAAPASPGRAALRRTSPARKRSNAAAARLIASCFMSARRKRRISRSLRSNRTGRGRVMGTLKNTARWGACLGLLLLLGACAFGDRKVTLAYQPEAAKAETKSAAAAPADAAAPATTDAATVAVKGIYVVPPFKDERPDKTVVGEV